MHFKREVARWKIGWAIEVQNPRSLSETLAELDFFLFYHWKNVADLANNVSIHCCILHIHWSKIVNIEGILDKFAGAANRRLTC